MDALGLGPGGGFKLGEAADLRAGEALRGHGTREIADSLISAEGGGDLGAFDRRGRIHPDRRRVTREDWRNLDGQRGGTIAIGERDFVAGGEVDAAVLLARDGDRVDLREIGQLREAVERELEAIQPEERISVHFTALPSADKSFRMSAVREVGAECRAGAGDRRAFRRIQHERRCALRGQVKTQDDRHSLSGCTR